MQEQLVDLVYGTHRCFNHLPSAFGQLEVNPPAVVGVGATLEIALVDKNVHELADGLLRNAKFRREVRLGPPEVSIPVKMKTPFLGRSSMPMACR